MPNPFTYLFTAKPLLDDQAAQRLTTWKRCPPPDLSTPPEQARYVVVDVETSGLSLGRDRLIAIGAVAVMGGEIQFGDSFEVVLQQQTVSPRDNILVHGIGGTAQSGGVPPQEALLRFLEYVGKSPLVAFHATFDETMLSKALRQHLGLKFKHPWLDLAYAVPALYPELSQKFRSLDDWLGHFGISNYARHNALADALCTAQLFLIAQTKARQANVLTFKSLQALEKAQRWVNWGN